MIKNTIFIDKQLSTTESHSSVPLEAPKIVEKKSEEKLTDIISSITLKKISENLLPTAKMKIVSQKKDIKNTTYYLTYQKQVTLLSLLLQLQVLYL